MLLSWNINVVWSLSLVLIVSDFILVVPDDANESRTTPVDSGGLWRLPGTPVQLGHCTSEVNWDMYTCGGTTHKLRLQSHPLIPQSFPVRREAPRQLQSGLRPDSGLLRCTLASSPLPLATVSDLNTHRHRLDEGSEARGNSGEHYMLCTIFLLLILTKPLSFFSSSSSVASIPGFFIGTPFCSR